MIYHFILYEINLKTAMSFHTLQKISLLRRLDGDKSTIRPMSKTLAYVIVNNSSFQKWNSSLFEDNFYCLRCKHWVQTLLIVILTNLKDKRNHFTYPRKSGISGMSVILTYSLKNYIWPCECYTLKTLVWRVDQWEIRIICIIWENCMNHEIF